jgi:hypothetical protein
MTRHIHRTATACVLLAGLALAAIPTPPAARAALPRFTEEREAAALFFVKKHLPELQPLLEQLRKSNASLYEQEICEIFQVTEYLADLKDEPRRHDLELRIWKAENRAHALAAQLSTPNDDERKKAEGMLMEVARELVDLDVAVLELKSEQLDKELGELKDELARLRDGTDKYVKDRYEILLQNAKGGKKPVPGGR